MVHVTESYFGKEHAEILTILSVLRLALYSR